MRLQLRKFDMSSIAADKVVVMIGKRDTGKSFLCKDLLWHHQKIPVEIQLYLHCKLIIVFMEIWFHQYLFITNIVKILYKES